MKKTKPKNINCLIPVHRATPDSKPVRHETKPFEPRSGTDRGSLPSMPKSSGKAAGAAAAQETLHTMAAQEELKAAICLRTWFSELIAASVSLARLATVP
jgi:hypothetical protein